MAANMPAKNVTGVAVPHCEFEMAREDVELFAMRLVTELAANPKRKKFHLQIEAKKKTPGPNAPPPIAAKAKATVSVFKFK